MKKRIISFILSGAIMISCFCGTAFAEESRASTTLAVYSVELFARDNASEVYIDYYVRAVAIASKVGVQSITLFDSYGNYVDSVGGSTENGLVCENFSSHTGTYSFSVRAGASYYAVVVIYARVGSDYDHRAITTSTVTV